MNWLWLVSYFFGGVFLANGIPHLVAGVMGRALQTPFAHPRGKGLSSSKLNTAWGFANLVIAYLLIASVGTFNGRAAGHILALGTGFFLKALGSAHQMGKFHGGNNPSSTPYNH